MAARTANADRDRYLELVRRLPLRPIHSDTDLDQAIEMINTLLDQESLEDGEKDYLDVLGSLVEDYETEEHPIPPASDADLLRHLIEAKGVSQTEVAQATGIVDSTISAVLAGKRTLNRSQIGKLAHYFNVEPNVFCF